MGPTTWVLLAATFPAAFASLRMGFPLQLAWGMILNMATFAALGAILEGFRRSVHRLQESHR
jgi:hypothetical protein